VAPISGIAQPYTTVQLLSGIHTIRGVRAYILRA